jgi:acyl-coenzyme A thioesterase PaaI-like protein
LAIPEGFWVIPNNSPYFDKTIGPFYLTERDNKWIVAMMTSERHVRGKGFVAGLVTATLADYAMGHVVCRTLWQDRIERDANSIKLVTVSLNVDFIASPPVGAWLEVETNVIKTGRICFAESLTKLGDRIMMRANASYIVRE